MRTCILSLCLALIPALVYAQSDAAKIDELLNNADKLKESGRPAEAVILAKTALELHQKSTSAPAKKKAQILRKLGTLSIDSDQPLEGIQYLEAALEVLQEIGDTQNVDALICYLALGLQAHSRGDFASQVAYLRRVVDIQTKLSGTDDPNTASSMVLLADGLTSIGQHTEALKLNRQALVTLQGKLGNNHSQVARAMIGVSANLLNLQQYADAGKQVDAALKILSQRPNASSDLADAYEMRGLVDSRLNNYTAAIANYKRAIRNFAKENDREFRIASTQIHLGQAYRLTGQLDDALTSFNDAMQRYTRLRGERDVKVATALYGIAEVSFLKQDWATALAACDQARRITRDHFINVLPFLPEREQLDFIQDEESQRFSHILSAASLQSDDDNVAALSAGWTINSKGLAQEALTQQNRILAELAKTERKSEVEELIKTRQQIAQLSLGKQTGVDAEINALNSKAEQLTRSLVEASAGTSTTNPWIELDDLRRSLDASTYVVQYSRFHQFMFDEQASWGDERYVAWVIPPAGVEKVRMVDLGPAEPIDKAIAEARREISQAAKPNGPIKQLGEEAATRQLKSMLARVRELVFSRVAPHVKKAKQLVLSPDSTLWLTPWPALPADDSSKFLIEQYTLRFVVSPSQLVVNEQPASDQQPPVIFADPKFDLTPDGVWKSIQDVLRSAAPTDAERTRSVPNFNNRAFVNVAPLPGTATEAALISPALESYTGKKPQQYMERFALETIARSMNSPSIIVFGTHGFFLGEDSTSGSAGLLLNRNPLSRCGLLMAGCKARDAGKGTAGDDGILTGMEIANLNLHETELVILSACETAVGTPRVGEGVASLSQAFQLAGARSVVAALWSVPDRESALLINKFVEQLAEGKSKAQALRDAQIERIEKRRERFGAAHPFFWSAFTVSGR